MNFKRITIVFIILLAIGLGGFVLIPKGRDLSMDVTRAGTGKARSVEIAKPTAGDLVFKLDERNVTIGFTAGKSIAGKIVNVSGGWSGKFGSHLTGTAIVDSKTRKLQQVRLEIDVASLWSEHEMLTRNLRTCGFFNIKDHPTATFISTGVEPASPAATTGTSGTPQFAATHILEGNFKLNGIEKSIRIPVRLEETPSGSKVESRFSIDRKDFDVIFRDNSAFPILNDGNILSGVSLKVIVEAGPNPGSVALNRTAQSGSAASTTESGERPASFHQIIPFSQAAFDMILVPGDAGKGIKTFYLGKTEVTWDEFLPWALCKDIPEEADQAEQRALNQRPSAPYIELDRGFGMEGRPALSMSRLSAELFCQWLSKQTGRKFRLPTEKEWEYAYEAGGGNLKQPMSKEEADEVAVWKGNSYSKATSRNMTLPVGSKKPDKLGLYDMAGNAAEWVTDTGNNRVIRGGHYESKLEQLGGIGREIENDDDWNMNYPGDPKSIWWFVDAKWVGFRVVCDPE